MPAGLRALRLPRQSKAYLEPAGSLRTSLRPPGQTDGRRSDGGLRTGALLSRARTTTDEQHSTTAQKAAPPRSPRVLSSIPTRQFASTRQAFRQIEISKIETLTLCPSGTVRPPLVSARDKQTVFQPFSRS